MDPAADDILTKEEHLTTEEPEELPYFSFSRAKSLWRCEESSMSSIYSVACFWCDLHTVFIIALPCWIVLDGVKILSLYWFPVVQCEFTIPSVYFVILLRLELTNCLLYVELSQEIVGTTWNLPRLSDSPVNSQLKTRVDTLLAKNWKWNGSRRKVFMILISVRSASKPLSYSVSFTCEKFNPITISLDFDQGARSKETIEFTV